MKSVVFLCTEERSGSDGAGNTPRASAFLVRVLPGQGSGVVHIVTARHVVQQARASGDRIFIRLNRKDGAFEDCPISVREWFEYDHADVAAIPFRLVLDTAPDSVKIGVAQDVFDHLPISVDHLVGPAPEYRFKALAPFVGEVDVQPRVGHELFFVGLFTTSGQARSYPIARFGHISRMPEEMELEEAGRTRFTATVYLAEFQAWGGSSGSPVFFLHPFVVQDAPSGPEGIGEVNLAWVPGILRLISGHFEMLGQVKGLGDVPASLEARLNSGVAYVTPADAVRELLFREDVVDSWKRRNSA